MTTQIPWLKETPDGVILSVYVKPRAARSKFAGTRETELCIQLAAPPVEGAANEELVDFLARALGVAKRDVTLLAGEQSRHKRVQVHGARPAQLEALVLEFSGGP